MFRAYYSIGENASFAYLQEQENEKSETRPRRRRGEKKRGRLHAAGLYNEIVVIYCDQP